MALLSAKLDGIGRRCRAGVRHDAAHRGEGNAQDDEDGTSDAQKPVSGDEPDRVGTKAPLLADFGHRRVGDLADLRVQLVAKVRYGGGHVRLDLFERGLERGDAILQVPLFGPGDAWLSGDLLHVDGFHLCAKRIRLPAFLDNVADDKECSDQSEGATDCGEDVGGAETIHKRQPLRSGRPVGRKVTCPRRGCSAGLL